MDIEVVELAERGDCDECGGIDTRTHRMEGTTIHLKCERCGVEGSVDLAALKGLAE